MFIWKDDFREYKPDFVKTPKRLYIPIFVFIRLNLITIISALIPSVNGFAVWWKNLDMFPHFKDITNEVMKNWTRYIKNPTDGDALNNPHITDTNKAVKLRLFLF